jgi:hypothetical protein
LEQNPQGTPVLPESAVPEDIFVQAENSIESIQRAIMVYLSIGFILLPVT